jgi:superfamily II DNA helicase RecQ
MASRSSSPSLSVAALVVNEQFEPSVSPVTYLRALPQNGVILCTEHQNCYTIQNIHRHLHEKHAVKAQLWKDIKTWIQAQDIAEAVSHPLDYSPFIQGLSHSIGYVCNTGECTDRTTSEELIQRHVSKVHGVDSRRKQRERRVYSKVVLQRFFAKVPEYFIVQSDATTPSSTPSILPTPSIPLSSSHQATRIDHDPSISSVLSLRIREAAEEQKARYRQIGEPNHVSEITPWLRKSGFHKHLVNIDGELIVSSHTVPKIQSEDARLYYIASAAERVLRQAYELVEELYHVDARTLNTFQANTITQDPFQELQNKKSWENYIDVFQSLVCYLIRAIDGHFGQEMFRVTDVQQQALDQVLTTAEKLCEQDQQHRKQQVGPQQHPDDEYGLHDSDQDDGDNGDHLELEHELDGYVLQWCITLVQQRMTQTYDSGIVSFCAAKATLFNHEDQSITWKFEGEIGGMLSKLIYCCQLIILRHAHLQVQEDIGTELGNALRQLCEQWIVNNSYSPVSTLSDWRLYCMKIGASTVPPAPLIWDEDGQTLTFRDIRYGIPDLGQEMAFCLREAQQIFTQELCLGFPDIPTFAVSELQDNWAHSFPGYSFTVDTRNTAQFEDQAEWLSQRIATHPDHLEAVFHIEQSQDHVLGRWPVRSEFAKQYQISVERFLECMLVLVHKGSGQPARRTEFLGLRWRNNGLAPRNLRLHSGHLLFILTYHKSQLRTHASRSPVRVLFPAVEQLLIQFLGLIQPFRTMIAKDTQIPVVVGDYLWSSSAEPWPEERMTRILRSTSRRCLGRVVNVQAWRQICVGIAVKKFSGMNYEGDVDVVGNGDDHELDATIVTDGITLPASFHAQTAHSAHTGNRAYGGSINFQGSLTDAGVQVYLWTSKLWWTLFEREIQEAVSGKRARPPSVPETPSSSLVKRVASRTRPPRQFRRWGSETVLIALRRLYHDPYAQFRSLTQQEMAETVASGFAEVVIILATGGGKSLSFMVPMFFPQAGTTVVILPLVALKQDMVRRCWAADIQFSVWSGHGDSQRFTGTPLLFVSAEQAVRQPFRQFLSQLDADRQLDRVVFDECHLILTASSYRPKLALLRYLRELRCQVVFLSATLPPLYMAAFQTRMLLDGPRIIRDITFRSDLRYSHHRQSRGSNFEDYMVEGIHRHLQGLAHEEGARMIVYVNRTEEARQMATRLGCESYFHDSGTMSEKEQVMTRWRQGEHRVIIATSAFGTGVDYAHVRTVIHQGLPTDAINFAQEVGRLGRDGQGGSSYVIVPRTLMPIDDATWEQEQHTTPVSQRVMQRYVSQSRCLWATLSRFVDGVEKMQYCGSGLLCSICHQQGTFPVGDEVDSTWYWDSQAAIPGESSSPPYEICHEQESEELEPSEDDTSIRERVSALLAGSQRLRASEQQAEEGRVKYLERCRRWAGVCIICQLLRGGRGLDHTLDDCRSVHKGQFLDAKKAAIQQGRGGGWMKKHVACWACGQPPTICDGLRGVKGCEFRDLVFPGAWAMFRMDQLWGQSVESVSGQAGGFPSEGAWMQWIGEECEVFGERGTQGVRTLEWTLEQMERGELREA